MPKVTLSKVDTSNFKILPLTFIAMKRKIKRNILFLFFSIVAYKNPTYVTRILERTNQEQIKMMIISLKAPIKLLNNQF